MDNRVYAPLSTWFDWDDAEDDPLGLYPFRVRCLVVGFSPSEYPQLLELGRPTLDFVYGRSERPSRQIKAGKVCLYFPERWLSVREKLAMMQSFVDLHDDYPLSSVYIITGEPIFLTDMTSDMVRRDPSCFAGESK